MRTVSWAGLATLLVSAVSAQQVQPTVSGAAEDQAIVRLAPAAFPSVPVPVREELERRRCTIPQVYGSGAPSNVVTGRFTSADQVDVAVLCSHNSISTILLFRRASTTSVAELASAPDRNFLQDMGGEMGFSRAIGAADPQSIQSYNEAFGGPKPPPLNHDGIEDAFVEKASVIWYWHDGRWMQFAGAD